MMRGLIGTVAELWRYPVKSMEGVRLDAAAVTPRGLAGDRAWALVDRATGRPLSAKRHAKLMLCRARFLDEPQDGRLAHAEITLPDGERARTCDSGTAARLSLYAGADCVLVHAPGGFFDDRPLHLLTDASLRAMRAQAPLDFDRRRFRPNILIASSDEGFPETRWLGRRLRIGELGLDVAKPTKRCVMTTHPQPALAQERAILTAVVKAGGALGVYGAVSASGVLRVGDLVGVDAPPSNCVQSPP